MNTEVFRKAVTNPKAKKYGMAGYRVGMITSMAWLFTHFATVKDLDGVRNWVRSLSESRTTQYNHLDKRQDNIEQRTAYIEGRLNFPLQSNPIILKTNTP